MVNDQAHQLMRDVLPLMEERWIDGAKIRAIADRQHLRTDEARIYFLRELLALVRRFPLKIYKDEEARQRMITAVQEALDAAIDEEDA
jgi:type III secretion protein W